MKKVRFEDKEVIVGLEWSVLAGEQSESKALSAFLAKNKGVKKGLVMKGTGVSAVGYPGASHKGSVPKIPSAAALLALANQVSIEAAGGLSSEGTSEEHNWIVVEQIEDTDEYWMGAVKNGVPLPGVGDLIGKKEDIIAELLSLFETGSTNFTVFTVDKDVRYNVVGQVTVIEKKFAIIVAEVNRKKAELKLFSVGAIVAVALIVLIMLGMAGAWGYTVWAEKKQQESRQRAAAAQRAAQTQQQQAEAGRYQEQVQAAILNGLENAMAEFNASLSTPSPTDTVYAWRSLIYNVDLYHSGWGMENIDCGLEGSTPICQVNLTRGDLGVNRLLLQDIPTATIEGDRAYYTLRGPAMISRTTEFRQVGSSQEINMGIISDLQEFRLVNIQHRIEASRDIVKQVNLPEAPALVPTPGAPRQARGAAGTNTTASIQLGFANGNMTVTGSGLWQLSGLATLLNRENIRIKQLTIQMSSRTPENANWTIVLEYFVRTLPQPVLPNVTHGETTITTELPAQYRAQSAVEGGGVQASDEPKEEEADAVESEVIPPPPPINQ